MRVSLFHFDALFMRYNAILYSKTQKKNIDALALRRTTCRNQKLHVNHASEEGPNLSKDK